MSQSARIKINEVYVPYINNNSRYLHLWGGSGSGKSVFAAQKLILRVCSEKPHRILCVRKVANTLRGSVYEEIKRQINELGLTQVFKINKSEMRFTHNNGNELLLAGLDDVERLKSIAGITSIWVEEATETSADDVDQLDLRLRGETANYKQIIFTYNPIDERHWLKERFHDIQADNITVLRTTFKDNYFVDDEYKRVLEAKISVNPNLYRIYYLGEWGREEVQRPYVFNFNKERTVTYGAVYNQNLPIYFSLDFNVEPFVCICAHIWQDGKGEHYHIFKELVIEKNGDVPTMIELIINTFGAAALSMAIFTGDAMQRKREITQRDNVHAWTMIEQRFRLGRRLMVPRANPSVSENRHLVNAICAFHPDFKVNPECKKLIYDLQFVEADAEGDIIKKNRNKEEQRADALDTFRYQCNTHFPNFLKTMRIK